MHDTSLPAYVPFATEPLGIFGSLKAARRNLLEILPELAKIREVFWELNFDTLLRMAAGDVELFDLDSLNGDQFNPSGRRRVEHGRGGVACGDDRGVDRSVSQGCRRFGKAEVLLVHILVADSEGVQQLARDPLGPRTG